MNPRSERRLCPRDSSVLVAEERKALFRHAQVDVCPRCQGVFLDKGEIVALIGHPNLGRFLLRAADPEAPMETQGCPNCGGILEDRIVAGMDIDVCEACRGFGSTPASWNAFAGYLIPPSRRSPERRCSKP